jgi:predicted transcriptional regulator
MKRTVSSFELGPLEAELMNILWASGELSVRDVAEKLGRPLAYTTVMTTLDRLFKKGLLFRSKVDRAFVYRCRWTAEEWDRKHAEHVVAGFIERPALPGDLLVSYLVDAVCDQDVELLNELERRVRLKRIELESRSKS